MQSWTQIRACFFTLIQTMLRISMDPCTRLFIKLALRAKRDQEGDKLKLEHYVNAKWPIRERIGHQLIRPHVQTGREKMAGNPEAKFVIYEQCDWPSILTKYCANT